MADAPLCIEFQCKMRQRPPTAGQARRQNLIDLDRGRRPIFEARVAAWAVPWHAIGMTRRRREAEGNALGVAIEWQAGHGELKRKESRVAPL